MFNFDVNQLTEQMKPAMDKFATTLGTTADKLLEIGVKGMFVEGLYSIVVCLLCIVAFVLAIISIKRAAAALAEDDCDFTAKTVTSVAFAIVGFFAIIGAPITFAENLKTAVINTAAPDYALLLKASSLILNKTP